MLLKFTQTNLILICLSFCSIFYFFGNSLAFADTKAKKEASLAAFDFGKPPKTRIQLLPNLNFGVRTKFEYQSEIDFDLDELTPDNLHIFQPSLSLAFSYTPTEYLKFFVNIEPSFEIFDDEENKKQNQEKVNLKQAFVSLTNIVEGTKLKIGRQRIKDNREWILDEELDSIRLSYTYSQFGFDAFVGENKAKDLTDSNDKDDKVTNYFAEIKFALNDDNEVGAYVFARDDRSYENENPMFFGLHINGSPWNRWEYWANLAHVRGSSSSSKIRGIGLDFGFTHVLDVSYKPAFTFGYAYGSGDSNPSDGEDNNFRQTGLQDNNDKFSGVARLKYYGELVDPELSNLHIFTGGIGVRPTKKTSVDLVYHYYTQDESSSVIRDSNIDEKANGIQKDIGQEIDLVAAYRSRKHLTTSLVLGYFNPGKAFSSLADNAFFTEVKIQYDF
jgi:alginate production protein